MKKAEKRSRVRRKKIQLRESRVRRKKLQLREIKRRARAAEVAFELGNEKLHAAVARSAF